MRFRLLALLALPLAAWCGDWNPALTARYLDWRAAAWAAWPRAAREGGPCVSCHTTLGYVMARPLLRERLEEPAPTEFETGLLAGVRVRAAKPAATPTADHTQAVMTALVLALEDRRRGAGVSAATESAFRTLWATQRADGAWGWTNANLEPWEVPESVYLGGALAAVATGMAPAGYHARPEIRPNLERLETYLRQNGAGQPLANRLVLVWAAAYMESILSAAERRQTLDALWNCQSEDGGWKLAALGPWHDRPDAPPAASGSSAFATAWSAAMARLAGISPEEPHLARALDWLRRNQNIQGYWDAASMNHRYEPGSMPELFMRDAATEYAVIALSGKLF